MTIRILQGDCRDVLATLPDASVHCVVTSPPYFGLRDYGTAQWDGGDAECGHTRPVSFKSSTLGASTGGRSDETHERSIRPIPYADTCGKCGARRVDRQIGLEASPDEFIAQMVAVFREVRRVLRPDGTLWLNLGSSYASGGKRPNLSPDDRRALACDNGGIEPPGSPAPDCAYPGHDDGFPDGSPTHRDRIVDTGLQTSPTLLPDVMTSHGSEPLALLGGVPSLPDALASTTVSLSRNALAASGPASEGAGLAAALTSPHATLASARMVRSTDDTASIRATSAGRTKDKALSSKACDCGSCGLCFAYSIMRCLRFKAKDLMELPHLVAMALQADGWYLRSSIVWAKPNPLPESVTDRPTSSHEHVFLLTKSARYFYDADAVREEAEYGRRDTAGAWRGGAYVNQRAGQDNSVGTGLANSVTGKHPETGRNLRNVWTIATEAFPESHFATFPTALVEKCVRAGTSERGCCPACGAQWVRAVTKGEPDLKHRVACGADVTGGYSGQSTKGHDDAGVQNASDVKRRILEGLRLRTSEFRPSCTCDAGAPVPATVLDPFAGAATTLLVADRLQRHAIGIELNPDYCDMARRRIERDAGMFATIADEDVMTVGSE